MMKRRKITTAIAALILSASASYCFAGDGNSMERNMCEKEQMTDRGIVRLSKIEVYPEYIDEYKRYATEVGKTSMLTEPGVITMYALADKENPYLITILETYSSQDAYCKHIASPHFQKYKKETLHMVKTLELCDQTPLNPDAYIINIINNR